MDIKFEKADYKFNVRSSCIIKDKKHENVILSYARAKEDTFILPGGRLELLETSSDAIKREIEEELGLSLEYKLISVDENINLETKFHMLEFVFYSEVDSFDKINNLDDGWDKFKIIKIKDIDNYHMISSSLKDLIKSDTYDIIEHNINYDWGK